MRRPAPGSPRWTRLVTGSKVAAIVGASTHDSPLSMWHKMRGDVPWDTGRGDPAVLQRGHLLEPAILAWWRAEHGVKARELRRQVFITRPDLPWAAATVDAAWERVPLRRRVIEAKTSAKDDEWGEPGTDQIPLDYLMQAYWSMALDPTVLQVDVVVLLSRFGFAEYVVARDEAVQDELVDAAAAFLASLDAGARPPLDDSLATRATLKALHPDVDRDATAWIDEALAEEWLAADLALKRAGDQLVGIQNRVLDVAGRARSIAIQDGRTVGRRQRNGHGGVSLVPIHPKKKEPTDVRLEG